jgi:hypothetical protein
MGDYKQCVSLVVALQDSGHMMHLLSERVGLGCGG